MRHVTRPARLEVNWREKGDDPLILPSAILPPTPTVPCTILSYLILMCYARPCTSIQDLVDSIGVLAASWFHLA